MKKIMSLAVCGLLVPSYPIGVWASEEPPVCNDIGELMFGDQQKCKKGDVIMVNPMMAAFLCDLTKPSIAADKTVVCHYLGKKRAERKVKK